MDGISINNWLISRILLPTEFLRVPFLDDYHRHSPSSFSPIAKKGNEKC